MLKKMLPWRIQNWLTERARRKTLQSAMEKLIANPQQSLEDNSLIEELIFGWGNEAWSAERAYLEACIKNALETAGPILECGSGISTLILATIAQKRDINHVVLENSPQWAAKIRQELDHFGLSNTHIEDCPIVPADGFSWYDVKNLKPEHPFNLIICDGPPSTTPGGRFGLLPSMQAHLAPSCRILLDDADREEEHAIVEKWKSMAAMTVEVEGGRKPYFNLVLEQN